jgi:flagellar biosynthesis protein FliP
MRALWKRHKVMMIASLICGAIYLGLSVPTFGQGATGGNGSKPAKPASPIAPISPAKPPANTDPAKADAGVSLPMPSITIGVGNTENRKDVNTSLQILFLLTVLTLAPSILVLTTGFTRMIIVLSLTRSAMGTQQIPPNAVLVGLALFLTLFVMAPVGAEINKKALGPYMKGDITFQAGVKLAEAPLREFMFRQTRLKDLSLFLNVAKIGKVENKDQVPTYVLIPSFVISELKTAFEMGFLIYLPFLIIDMVVSSTLMSMGMMMLPPILISLPFKVLLFVLVDGWHLITRSLILSFN